MKTNRFSRTLLATAVAATLVACGGGSGGGGSSSTGATKVSKGVVTGYGSIVVNGIHYDETGARVRINDRSGSGDYRGIKIGMTVKIRGSLDSPCIDGINICGVANSIEVEHEVEGAITSISGTTFVVHGLTINTSTDPQTLTRYDGITGDFSGLTVGMRVEVYGLRDPSGVIQATLIELEDDDFEDEIRGVVSDLDTTAGTFKLGSMVVHYDTTGATTRTEDGTLAVDLVDGATVEVHLDLTHAMPNHASKIEFEDNEDSEYDANDGDEVEVEGYISEYSGSVPGTFKIGTTLVSVTETTQLGFALANGLLVEVEGTMVGIELVATEVELED
jgi:Domain of unknown function (DUF5666)